MSSVESMISEVEEDYERILKSFENYLSNELVYRFRGISEKDLLKLLRSVMNFQRKIEYFVESTLRLLRKTGNTERFETIASGLLDRLSDSTKEFDNVQFYNERGYPDGKIDIIGAIPLLKKSHGHLLQERYESNRRLCYCAYFSFKLLQSSMIELEEEMRLIGALTTYPIEKKTRLKHKLVINDFEEVAVSLEEAESNVEAEHFKDCVSRCRDAVEIFVASVREKETGEKTERHFATDLANLVKIGVFEEATRKLAQGVYSFLGLKGSHKYNAKKVTVYDAETSLKETYSLLEMLVKRYLDLKKAKKKTSK